MATRRYVDKSGKNYTQADVEVVLSNVCLSAKALDYMQVGEIYENGSLWFQRDE